MNISLNTTLSVSEFTQIIKKTLETSIVPTWIRGEVSNLRLQNSGHIYFTLKDAQSQISCVFFKGDALRHQQLQLKDGLQVVLFGELSLYEPRGTYQIIARIVSTDGMGKLHAAFELLKKQLESEGLFDPSKKRPLPPLPKTIGFITSPTGAVIHDFISILTRCNWKGAVILLPAKVQGQDAPEDLFNQLQKAYTLPLDLLIIGRGGGSTEDLWCFNDPTLVRTVATSPIPIISAVGHETDFTLCDFAADYRAETPSAAAELISSNYLNTLHSIEKLSHRLQKSSPLPRLEFLQLKLDDLSNRLHQTLQRYLDCKKTILLSLKLRLRALHPLPPLQLIQNHLYQLSKRLEHSSTTSILKRGFAFIQSTDGFYIKTKGALPLPPSTFLIHFQDGLVKATIPNS